MKSTILALLLAGTSAFAFTIDEAVEMALKQSPESAVSQAALESAKAGETLATSGYYPTLDLRADWTRIENPSTISASEQTTYGADAKYNLFNGFADKYGRESAKSAVIAADYGHRGTVADVALETRTAFLAYLRAADALEIANASLALLESKEKDAQAYFGQGIIAKNELLQVKVERAKAREARLQAQSGLRLAKAALESRIGAPLPGEPALPGSVAVSNDQASLKASLLENRQELKALEQNAEAAAQSLKSAKSGYYPTVDLTASYEKYEREIDLPAGFTLPDDQTMYGVSANWNLFNGKATSATVQQSSLAVKQARARADDGKRLLLLELDNALEKYNLAGEAMEVAQATLEFAEENYRITEARYDAQVADATELLDAQANLTQAKSGFSTARFDRLEAAYTLKRVAALP